MDLRLVVLTLAALAFAAGLILEPASLSEIARFCQRGHCGVRPFWLELAGAAVIGGVVSLLVFGRRTPSPKPKRKARPAAARRPKA